MVTLPPDEISDLLANLVERSLVVFDDATGRYHLPESMRAFALEQLGSDEAEGRRRHLGYFLAYSERIDLHLRALAEAKAHALFEPELDNFRAAFEWSLQNDPEGCLLLVRRAGPSWQRDHRMEADALLLNALRAAREASHLDRAAVRLILTRGLIRTGQYEEMREQLRLAREHLDLSPEADPILDIRWHFMSGICHSFLNEPDLARKLISEGLELAKAYGNPEFETVGHVNLGEISRDAGELREAIFHYEEALRLSNGDYFHDALILFNLGSACIEAHLETADEAPVSDSGAAQTDNLTRAEECFRRALSLLRAGGSLGIANATLGGLGFVLIHRGLYREAGLLMGYGEAGRQQKSAHMDPIDATLFSRHRDLGSQLGGKVFEEAFDEGGELKAEQLDEIVDGTVLE